MEELKKALFELPTLDIMCDSHYRPCENKAVLYMYTYWCANCAFAYACQGPDARKKVEEAIQFKQRYPGRTAKCRGCENPAMTRCVRDGVPICQAHAWYDPSQQGYVCTIWCAPLR